MGNNELDLPVGMAVKAVESEKNLDCDNCVFSGNEAPCSHIDCG